MSQRTTSQLIGAGLVGGMIGAVGALMLSPRSGRENRERMQANLKQARNDAEAKLSQAKSRVRHQVDEARDLKDRLTEAARQPAKREQTGSDESDSSQINTSLSRERVLSAWEEEL